MKDSEWLALILESFINYCEAYEDNFGAPMAAPLQICVCVVSMTADPSDFLAAIVLRDLYESLTYQSPETDSFQHSAVRDVQASALEDTVLAIQTQPQLALQVSAQLAETERLNKQ